MRYARYERIERYGLTLWERRAETFRWNGWCWIGDQGSRVLSIRDLPALCAAQGGRLVRIPTATQ